MMRKEEDIFSLIQNIEGLKLESPRETMRSQSSFAEDQYFRSSSIDYFKSSSITSSKESDGYYHNSGSSDEEPVQQTFKLSSKHHMNPRDFEIISRLGQGAYAKVLKVRNRKTNELCAMKIIEKRLLEKEAKMHQVYVENEVLNMVKHPNIVEVLGVFEDSEKFYIFMEFCMMGDLSDFILKNIPFDADVAKFFLAQALLCIEYLNSLGIVHRDIKPENFLITDKFQLKLCDFSTASIKGKVFDWDKRQLVELEAYLANCDEKTKKEKVNWIKNQNFVGTAEYMAPEVVNNMNIGLFTDLWSFGCMVYQTFMGYPPFRDKTQYLIFQKILKLEYEMDQELIPEEAQNLITMLLKLEPRQRLGANPQKGIGLEKLKDHRFFKHFSPQHYVENVRQFLSSGKSKPPFNNVSKKETSDVSTKSDFEETREKILKMGILKKKSPWLHYDRRKVILYNTPRIDYLDPELYNVKGSIPLNKNCRANLLDPHSFELSTPNRTYTFLCKSKFDIRPWVSAINDCIDNYST